MTPPDERQTGSGGAGRLRAIDVDCPECGAHPGYPCISLKDLHRTRNTGFAHRAIKSLHYGRYFEATFLRDRRR